MSQHSVHIKAATYKGNPSRSAFSKTIDSKFRSCGGSIGNVARKIRNATRTSLKRLWRGDADEQKKVVLEKGLKPALARCSVHLLAVSATTTLAYFDLAGYFIGSQYQGLTGGVYQALDTLCLQVTAKLLELLIVASLGMILMDIIRHQLLFGSEGLPLGILASKQQFTEVQFLLSPELRFDLAGFSRRRKRLLFGLFIPTSTLISLFAGPSAALLLIPTQRSDWPAGGASFWLTCDEDCLWPSTLTASSVGGSDCENPDIKRLSDEALNSSGCIWAGHSSIVEAFRQRHLNPDVDLIVDDGVFKRNFVLRTRGEVAETWVLAIHMAVGVLSKNVANAWYDVLKGISISSWHYTLRYRILNETVGSVESLVPAVRVDYDISDSHFYNDSGGELEVPFPFLAIICLNVTALISAKYPDLPEYGVRLDLGYWIETNTINSSNISAQWVPVPKNARLSDDSHTTDMPGAFLSVQVPYINSNETGTTFTCSVDARWAVGIYSGGPVGDVDADYIQKATIKNTRPFASDLTGYQYNFLPIDDGSWRRVQMDMYWLYALTPLLGSSTSGWTSLAALLTEIGMDNSTGIIKDWWEVLPMLETIIATFVADGMSRQGYKANGGSSSVTSDALSLLPWDDSAPSQQSLLAGTYAFPRPADTVTQLHWSVVVGGYAYQADTLAYYLALTVLFLHAAIALGHVGYVLWTRVCCDAWDSFIGLMVLTARSGTHRPSGAVEVFKNASVGTKRYQTMSTPVRLRALTTSGVTAAGQEDVEILFGDQTLPVEYGTIEANKAYG